MKPIKILLIFLGLFTLYFIFYCIIHSDLLKSGEANIKQLFSDISQSLNLSLLFTFIWSFEKIKKIQSVEVFKAQRKNLVISVFLFTWISNGIIMVLERLILKHEIVWINDILFSLLWAVISMLLSLLFSGAFMKRKLINE
jgi:hypothetical protein